MSSSNIVQIIFAVFLVLLLTFIAYVVYNRDIITNFSKDTLQREVQIFDGILDFESLKYKFDTFDKSASSYKDLTPSVNQQGGAEYSYNFWLYFDDQKLSGSRDYILFMRGNDMKVPYINSSNCILQKNKEYYLVKNPLVRLTKDASALIVEYNTITSPDAYREYGNNIVECSSNDTYKKNKGMLGIYNLNGSQYQKKWSMITIVMQETNPDGDILYKNKTSCKIYMNGSLVLDRNTESPYDNSYGSTTMRHNRGKLFVNVDSDTGEDSALKMANMSYFNYSLGGKDIMNLFNKGFTKSQAAVKNDDEDDNMHYISKMDEDNLPKPF
jgi:hypothetical protein